MPPKKRDKDGDSAKNPRMDHIQADHELFLQAFEKPTQIYRFLRTRNMISPIFLNRTLTYMKQRMSRNNKSRKGFKIDSLLERKTKKNDAVIHAKYMNLTFLGFYDKTLESHPKTAQVETAILKVSHKKRKDSSSPVFKVSFGTSDVSINPSESSPPPLVPAACIPTESFCLSNGSLVKSYILLLKVQYMSESNTDSKEDEPAVKRRKSTNSIVRTFEETKLYCSELTVYDKHNRCLLTDGDYELGLNEFTPLKTSPKKHSSWENISDLDNCDNLDFNKGPSLKFKLSWSETESCGLVDRPKLYASSENKENNAPATNHNNNSTSVEQREKFQIIYQFVYNNNSRQQTEACEDLHCPWCSVDCGALYSLLKHLKLCHPRFSFTYVPVQGGARIDVAINELYDGSYAGSPQELAIQPGGRGAGPARRSPVTHVLVSRCAGGRRHRRPSLSEFVGEGGAGGDAPRPFVSGHSRLYHHTSTCLAVQPRELDMHSVQFPWLLMDICWIDFCSPQELAIQPGGRGAGPARRSPVTHVLVSRCAGGRRHRRPSLSEFVGEGGAGGDAPRPFVSGHSRLYHHTSTCLAVQPRELDMDSEDEPDPEWLRAKTAHMIDEFTDVNEGEKELMKMWNLHVMKHGYVGDCQIPLACSMFVQEKGPQLLLNNLYRNFVLHLCSLFDFGLISPGCLYGCILRLQRLVGETGEIRTALTQSRSAQVDHWVKVGSIKTPIAVRTAPINPSGGRQSTPARRRASEQHPPSKKRLSLSLKKEEPRSS